MGPNHAKPLLLAFAIIAIGNLAIAGEETADPTNLAAENKTAGEIDQPDAFQMQEQDDPCDAPDAETDTWLDDSQQRVYEAVCVTTAWVDGFFGDKRFDPESGNTFGRMGLSTFWDERDGFDDKFRFRASFALPALKNRWNLLLGKGDEKQLIEERSNFSNFDEFPSAFDTSGDDSFLVGLGYSKRKGIKRGFRFSGGVRVGTPLRPFLKALYARAWDLDERTLLRVRPIGYWRSGEGLGSTLHVDTDRLLHPKFLLRWANFGNVSQDREVEGVDWGSTLSLYQSLSDKRVLTYRTFVRGETRAEVPMDNYGVELRYRMPVLRKWLFLDMNTSITWPKEFEYEKRESNFGAGIGLEMFFGPAPDAYMR